MLRALVSALLVLSVTSALSLRAPAGGPVLSSCLKPWKGCPEGGSLSGSRLGENFAGFSEAMTMYDGSKSEESGSTSAWTGENGLDRAASQGIRDERRRDDGAAPAQPKPPDPGRCQQRRRRRRSGPGLPRVGFRQVTCDFARTCFGTLRVRKGYSAVQ